MEGAARRQVSQIRRRARYPLHRPPLAVHGWEAVEQAIGVREPGSAEDRVGGGPLDEPPGIHHRDLVGQLHQQGEVVGDEEGGEAQTVAELHQLLEDLPLGHHVERGGRLVQDHQLGVEGQGHADHGALTHPSRELVGEAAQPVAGHSHQLQQLDGPRPPLRCGKVSAVDLQQIVELGTDRDHWVESVEGALQDHGDLVPPHRAQLAVAGPEQVEGAAAVAAVARLGVEEDLSFGDQRRVAQEAQSGHGEGGLAAAALTGKAHHLSTPQRQVALHDGVDSVDAQAVVDGETSDLQNHVRGARRASRPAGDGAHPASFGALAEPLRRGRTVVKPRRGRAGMPNLRATLRESPPMRSRGLMNSSMPKLTSAKPVPTRAMQMPGGTHHHQNPLSTAPAALA